MVLNNLFGSRKRKKRGSDEDREEEYIELDATSEAQSRKVVVRIATLNEFSDVEEVLNMLRNNSLVWVKIKPLKEKDMSDLKRAIDRLKKTVTAMNGDIAGVDEDWIIACPGFAQIHR